MRALVLGLLSILMTQSVFAKSNDPSVRPDLQIKTIQNIGFNGAGISDELSFDIPNGTKSFIIQFTAPTEYAGISFDTITDPTGHIVAGQAVRKFKYAHPSLIGKYPEMEWENPTEYSFAGRTTALVPNNFATKALPGKWKMKFHCKSTNNDCQTLKGTVQVVVKKATTAGTTPTIPLRLHFPGKAKWTAASAPRNKDFKLFMKVLEDVFKFAGFNIEVLSMEDNEDTVFRTIAEGDDYMLKHSKGDAVNIYFAKTSFDWMGTRTMAISYSLPGGYMNPYTSGIIIRTKTIFTEEEERNPNKLDYVSLDSHTSIPKYALTRPMK